MAWVAFGFSTVNLKTIREKQTKPWTVYFLYYLRENKRCLFETNNPPVLCFYIWPSVVDTTFIKQSLRTHRVTKVWPKATITLTAEETGDVCKKVYLSWKWNKPENLLLLTRGLLFNSVYDSFYISVITSKN